MIPLREDREWLVGVVGLHLATTSAFGRRETEYVDCETVVVWHESSYTLGDAPLDEEPNSRSAFMEAVAEAICKTGHRPGRMRVTCSEHEVFLSTLSFLREVEIVEDSNLDLDALIQENPPWTVRKPTPEDARKVRELVARLHTAAAQLRRASVSCGVNGDVEFVFDIPAIGISGSACLDRARPGLEGLYLGDFEVDSRRAGPLEPFWEELGLTPKRMWDSVELLHLTRAETSSRLQQERAEFVVDGEPYPIVEVEHNETPTHDAGEREVRVACLVAQGLAAFLQAEGKQVRKRVTLRGEYDAYWGDEVFTVRIIRPERTR